MSDSTTRDDLDTPGWMRQVVASDLTPRILAKARQRDAQLRHEQANADPRASVFIDGARDEVERARQRWEPGSTREWWTTASRNAALQAYVSALEFSEVDESAAAAVDRMRSWFASAPDQQKPPKAE